MGHLSVCVLAMVCVLVYVWAVPVSVYVIVACASARG